MYELDPDNPPPLTPEQEARLQALAEMPDSEIDTTDIPELDWENGVVVRNPWADPPLKTKLKEVALDSDIVFWIVNQAGEEWQEKMNAMLRRAMQDERGGRTKA